MSTYTEFLPIAIQLASNAHGSTMNKDKTPYILHPIRLMMNATDDIQRCIAILHDTIEDTDLTLEELESEGCPPYVLSVLDLLTHKPEDDYQTYIQKLSEEPTARTIKLLDLYDNIDITRLPEIAPWDLQRIKKYHNAIKFLEYIRDYNSDQIREPLCDSPTSS